VATSTSNSGWKHRHWRSCKPGVSAATGLPLVALLRAISGGATSAYGFASYE
jgi:hypothetical protein